MKKFKIYLVGKTIEIDAKRSTDAIKIAMHTFPDKSVLRCEPVNELIPKKVFIHTGNQFHVENACKCENKPSFNRLQCPKCSDL